jgi:shikimate kinase
MNIFLIGFMGSGKTHWGKLWAAESGMSFYDLDHMIEEAAGKTVAEIFEEYEENYFREKEKEIIRTFADRENCIVSCGGGTPCQNDNMQWMNEHGTTVYLLATPRYIYDRVVEEKEKRPLLKRINEAELLFFIEQKLKQREAIYKEAQIILPVEELSVLSIKKITGHE